MSDKTEEPTPKRRRKAREDGDTPISAFATQSVAFMCAVALVPAAVRALWSESESNVRAALARAANPEVAMAPMFLARSVLILVVPLLAATALVGVVTSQLQSGGVLSPKKLAPDLKRLDFVNGFRQLASPTRSVAVLRALLLASAVGYLAYRSLRAHVADLVHATGSLRHAGTVAATLAGELALQAAVVALSLAVIDVIVTRRSWLTKMRMSKSEVKREYKESEGDPDIKAARERAHHEMLASVAIANVRNATVVVVNPTHLACALRYNEEEGDEAPVLVASGMGELAHKIVEAAHAYGIPVLQDVPLARALIELETGTAIPEALYEAVAEILREAWEAEVTPE